MPYNSVTQKYLRFNMFKLNFSFSVSGTTVTTILTFFFISKIDTVTYIVTVDYAITHQMLLIIAVSWNELKHPARDSV